jgi:hypothetical protein
VSKFGIASRRGLQRAWRAWLAILAAVSVLVRLLALERRDVVGIVGFVVLIDGVARLSPAWAYIVAGGLLLAGYVAGHVAPPGRGREQG